MAIRGIGQTTIPAPTRHRSGSQRPHIVGQIGGEKFDHPGTILDRPEPPKADQFGPVAIALNAAPRDRRHDPPCCDHAMRLALKPKAQDPGSDRKTLCPRPS